MSSWSVETVLSVSSFFVALCAFFLTVWQFSVQRRHNRISVKPHLIKTSRTTKRDNLACLEIILINNGLGPAYIDNFQILYKGKICDPDKTLKTVLGSLMRNSSITILGDDYAVSEKQVIVLLSIIFSFQAENEIEAVTKKLNDFDVLIDYSSAYEKLASLDSRLAR
jgi:hypothetical protein